MSEQKHLTCQNLRISAWWENYWCNKISRCDAK